MAGFSGGWEAKFYRAGLLPASSEHKHEKQEKSESSLSDFLEAIMLQDSAMLQRFNGVGKVSLCSYTPPVDSQDYSEYHTGPTKKALLVLTGYKDLCDLNDSQNGQSFTPYRGQSILDIKGLLTGELFHFLEACFCFYVIFLEEFYYEEKGVNILAEKNDHSYLPPTNENIVSCHH